MSALWQYTGDKKGSFRAPGADQRSRLYYPLMNEAGLRSSVTPDLKGDINGGFSRYLMPPVVTEDLHRSANARYVWIKAEGLPDWNVNGLSPDQQLRKWQPDAEHMTVEARPGTFTISRIHPAIPLEVKVQLTVPQTPDQVELWKVSMTNHGKEPLCFTPFFALPLFGRHADNLRDHRQVTTMFQRCYRDPAGTRIKPMIVHDESGHQVNEASYFAYYFSADGGLPTRVWTRMQDFIGEGGSLMNPRAVALDTEEPGLPQTLRDGMDAVSAAAFAPCTLTPGQAHSFVAVVGITDQDDSLEVASRYDTEKKFDQALQTTFGYWEQLTGKIRLETGHPDFDEWMNWLAFQLKARQIFGNSYLPDFGYGRGGRGWRDLWQDLLSVFLVDPESARDEIVNNLKGIRMDGSNATIIGDHPGEFKADRNNIARSWCDHGAWPLFTLDFYIQQTGDLDVLLSRIPYWKDQFIRRSQQTDPEWSRDQGTWQLTRSGKPYEATVLEHVLLQQLSAFYHVGEHNILRLEGADWNDTLDMARTRGESVCFESFYAGNLRIVADWLRRLKERGISHVSLLKEATCLLDRTPEQSPVDYENPQEKNHRLNEYFDRVSHRVSGDLTEVGLDHLISDLEGKAWHITAKIRRQEWIPTPEGGFFNGHYNNRGEPLHGAFGDGYRMDLTSQVIPLMFDVPDDQQAGQMYQAARSKLGETGQPGLRLCTPYPDIDLDVGRITGFVYGHKEHGSKWMQQNIMFMYALYKRGMSEPGNQMLEDVFKLTHTSERAVTFPGVPSYFEPGDRGAYMYLTGSSTWLYLTIVTRIFGIRGSFGKLIIQPRIPVWLFDSEGNASISASFRNHRIQVIFKNPGLIPPEKWIIKRASVGEVELPVYETKWISMDPDVPGFSEREPAIIVIALG